MSVHNAETAKYIYKRLKQMKGEVKSYLDFGTGICNYVNQGMYVNDPLAYETRILMETAFREWPEFSGTINCPIMVGLRSQDDCAINQFYDVRSCIRCIKTCGEEEYSDVIEFIKEYTAARERLLDYLIKYMEAICS